MSYGGSKDTMGIANNEKRATIRQKGHRVSSFRIKHHMSDYWFLVPCQTLAASSGTRTRGEAIPMFPHFKNITSRIVLDTAGALFGEPTTSVFYRWRSGAEVRFVLGLCHEEVLAFFRRTTTHKQTSEPVSFCFLNEIKSVDRLNWAPWFLVPY